MKKVLALIAILFIAVNSSATIFYVATTGNDATGNGSISQPWKTLSKATSTVTSAGNTIHVNAGTYLEVGQMFLSPGVNLEGDGVTSLITSSWGVSFFPMLDMTSIEGTNGNQYVKNIKFDGRNYATPRGIEIGGRSNVSFHDVTVTNFKEEGVIFEGRQSFDTLPPSIYATGNLFYNNIVTDCSMFAGFGRGCLSIGGQIGMLIHDNVITQPLRTGGNQIGWPIKYFSEGYLRGVKIYNNTITKAAANGEGWNFCMELFNISGLEIYNNTCQGSLDFNFAAILTYPYSLYVHDNTIGAASFNFAHTEDGIIIEYPMTGCWIKKNKFRNLSTGVVFYTRPSALIKDVEIEQNLFANFGNSSEGVGAFIGGFGNGTNKYTINGLRIWNNSFQGLAANRIYNGVGLGQCDSGQLKNIDIRNNSFQNITNDVFKAEGTVVPDSVIWAYNNVKDVTYNSTPNLLHIPTHYTSSPNYTFTPIFVDTINYLLPFNSPFIGIGQNVGYGIDLGYASYNSVINPIANAGIDQAITLPTSSVIMAGSGTAGTYSIVSHVWTQVGGAIAIITTPTSYTTTITGLGAADTYTFRLTVIDSMGNTDHDDMVVTVSNGSGVVTDILVTPRKFANAHH